MSTTQESKPRNETEYEKLDRQLMELFQGFRVAVTGVQVLFAFLLTVPFAAGFDKIDHGWGRALFYVALFGTALASICFIAPVAQHRILFTLGEKPLLIRRANRFGIVGAAALAISFTASTALIVQTLDNGPMAVLTGVLVLGLCSWAWFLQPYLTRMASLGRGNGDDDRTAPQPVRAARTGHGTGTSAG